MTDESSQERRPFGSRKDGERQQPFGSRGSYRRRQQSRPRRATPRQLDPPIEDFEQEHSPPEVEEPVYEVPESLAAYEPAPYADDLLEPAEELDEPLFDVDILEEAIRADQAAMEASQAEYYEDEEVYDSPEYTRPIEVEPEDQQVALNPLMLFRSAGIMVLGAAVVATMFTWWSPNAFLSDSSIEQLSLALATQSSVVSATQQVAAPPAQTLIPPTPTEVVVTAETMRIGIVSGHLGLNPSSGLPDPGAVCADGLTEQEVNFEVATRVIDRLEDEGFEVDLLEEFDDELSGYQAQAVVSIHADSCEFYNEFATGYKVASFLESQTPDRDEILVGCLSENYAEITGLGFHPSVTYDMTQYHNFREIAPQTPGAIIELGFLYLDRDFLTSQPDVAADGIVEGILCFINYEEEEEPTATPDEAEE